MQRQATDDAGFMQSFRGRFVSALRWHQLDALWETLRKDAGGGWYLYAVGEVPPEGTATAERVSAFIDEVDRLLRQEHEEDYCGIVYSDDPERPTIIKIYDPNNLGVVCGYSESSPLPGWVLSKLKPVDLRAATPPPGNRRRWWRRLLSV